MVWVFATEIYLKIHCFVPQGLGSTGKVSCTWQEWLKAVPCKEGVCELTLHLYHCCASAQDGSEGAAFWSTFC